MGFELDVARWNYKRNGLEGDIENEINMFDEEVEEWNLALKQYLEGTLFVDDVLTDLVDALCDTVFVNSGSKSKGFFRSNSNDIIAYMVEVTNEVLLEQGINPSYVIGLALELVVRANELKPTKKVKGKVSKGNEWVDPKVKIKELLLAQREIEEEDVIPNGCEVIDA